MKRLGILLLAMIVAVLFSIKPLQAATQLIINISISGDNLHKNINFAPSINSYTVYLATPGEITVDIQAGRITAS